MKVAVVTALWYEDKFLPALFASLEKVDLPHEEWEVIMIDNKNSALTKKWFAENVFPRVGKTLPPVTLLETAKNLGFAGGNNACLRVAFERGCEAVYLLNEDAHGDPQFLRAATERMFADENIGAVQSFLVLDQADDRGGTSPSFASRGSASCMNSIGNCLHFLGFSYCDGYRMPRHDAAGYLRIRSLADSALEIAAASGAAVLLRKKALDHVGLLDENYHLYHEDLDLSLRLREAGYMLVIEPSSVVHHRYEFGRSTEKYYWMERNRFRLLLEHYSVGTLLVLLPGFAAAEIGLIAYGALNGTLGARLRAYGYIFNHRNWPEIAQKRARVRGLKSIKDRELLDSAVSAIGYQDAERPAMKLMNALMAAYWFVVKRLIYW